MARRRFTDMNCAVAQSLDQIGDWWTLLIVREAFYGTTTFSAFQENLGIARNILSERLAQLVESGVMAREQTRPGVERHTYRLTDKGRDLLPVLVALMQWGDKWVVGPGGEPIRLLDAQDREPIRSVEVTAGDGRPLSIDDLRFRPGPGADPTTRARFDETRARLKDAP